MGTNSSKENHHHTEKHKTTSEQKSQSRKKQFSAPRLPGKVSVVGVPKNDHSSTPLNSYEPSIKPIVDHIDLFVEDDEEQNHSQKSEEHSQNDKIRRKNELRKRSKEVRTVHTSQSLLDALADQLSFSTTGVRKMDDVGTGGNNGQHNSTASVHVGAAEGCGEGQSVSEWYLLFSSKYHGSSFSQLAAAACQRGPTVLIIEASAPDGEGSQQFTVSVDDENDIPYWQQVTSGLAARTDGSTRRSTPARVHIGGFTMGNWLNNSQRERNAKRAAAANFRATRDASGGQDPYAPVPLGSPAGGVQPYATGTLAFLNPTVEAPKGGNNGALSAAVEALAGSQPYAPATCPSYDSTIPSGTSQSPFYHGNENCWLFRADVFTPKGEDSLPTATDAADQQPTKEENYTEASLALPPNYGYFNGRGDFRTNITNFRVYRPNSGIASKPKANYQYLVDQHHDAEMVGIGMGGDLGSWAWFIDKWLEHGTCNVSSTNVSANSGPSRRGGGRARGGNNDRDDEDGDEDSDPGRLKRCRTFNTLLLAPWRDWKVHSVELFAVDPLAVDYLKGIDLVRAEALRRADEKETTQPTPSQASDFSLHLAPIAATPEGDFIATTIAGCNGDLTLAVEQNVDQIAKNKKTKRGILHGEGAAVDKMILEMNNKNEFREDVVEDERFDRTKGC